MPPSTAALPLVADARVGLDAARKRSGSWQRRRRRGRDRAKRLALEWHDTRDALTTARRRPASCPPTPQVIGAVQRLRADSAGNDIVVCAAGTLPGELHKLWRAGAPGGYHMEYGFSCMGYEIAGGLGVKMARPDARSDRDGRRRQLHDDELRDRDLGDAGLKLHRRRARQPRLRLHQPPAAGDAAARPSTTCSKTAWHEGGMPRRSTSRPMRAASAPRPCMWPASPS